MNHGREMREKPILFSGPMVRAILNGSKTQTRRIAKPPRGWEAKYPFMDPTLMADPWETWWWNEKHEHVGVSQVCPYGKPGDHLWVREAWATTPELDDTAPRDLPCDTLIGYEAGGDYAINGFTEKLRWHCKGRTRPSIHMPRWASRINLEITGVRVERLQAISEDDALAEGVGEGPQEGWVTGPVVAYADLWDSINGKDAWLANPWVWVVTFRIAPAQGIEAVARSEARTTSVEPDPKGCAQKP